MRDLLTDLVRRARRPESTVQPRLPSAYESLPQTSHEDVANEDAVTRAPVASVPPPSLREHAQRPPSPWTRERRDSPAIVTTGMRSAPAASRDTTDHSARQAHTAAPVSSGMAPAAAPVTSVSAAGRVPAAAGADAPATTTRVPAVSVAPREGRAPVLVAIRPVSRPELPHIRRVRPEPLRERAADAREQPGPEIRISIGRIEVRATIAERPPVRHQPSSPTPLTLDEYLATRARRGTR